MLESSFQRSLVKDIENKFPGSIIIKNDTSHKQGFPDLTILYKNKWAVLECKRSKTAPHQPNQDKYVDILDKMSFSRFVYPENKEEVLDELQQAFKPRRSTRVSKREQVSLD